MVGGLVVCVLAGSSVLRMDSVSEPAYLSQFLTLCGQPELLDDASDLPSAINLFSCAGGWEGGGGGTRRGTACSARGGAC